MAFKDDASFMRFVTMGALGTHRAWVNLEKLGHKVIELERYSASNKIWATKIKRLRLADLLCVNCGVRFEVRAKSTLEIKMSHARNNPARYWDNGLGDQDIVIFILCREVDDKFEVAETLNAFEVGELRKAQHLARLGPPKSASEGSESDLVWPSWVPKKKGVITSVTESLKILYDDGRSYTYNLDNKYAYVRAGEQVKADEQMVAGCPKLKTDIRCSGEVWKPSLEVQSRAPNDLYAEIKAVGARNLKTANSTLQKLTAADDIRLRLEAAGVLLRLGDPEAGNILVAAALNDEAETQWAMEAVLILSEIPTAHTKELLRTIANKARQPEVRSAAVWGLGEINADIETIVPFLGDEDSNVACHAVMVISDLIKDTQATKVISDQFKEGSRVAAAACEALALSTNIDANYLLGLLDSQNEQCAKWAFTTLSRLNPQLVMSESKWPSLPSQFKESLERMWFWTNESWFANREVSRKLHLLTLQKLSKARRSEP